MSQTKRPFHCPDTMRPHAVAVFRGEYAIDGFTPSDGATILDVGANVGAFACWARHKWPTCKVESYEPVPSTVELLRKNVDEGVTVHPVAVFTDGKIRIYEGRNNIGEASAWKGHEQADTFVDVDAISPHHLPPAEFLKVDTEGAEVAVLAGYPHLETLRAVALEWHSPRDKQVISALLRASGFTLVADVERALDRGVQKWLRRA